MMQLFYFDLRNLAEPIRVFLHYLDVPFVDNRLDMEQWAEIKNDMPQGKMPVLEVEGKRLGQSASIMRYLGRVHNLTGRNNIERAVVDSIADLNKDLYTQISSYYYVRLGVQEGDKDELEKKVFLPGVQAKFPIFVKHLKEAHSGYYAKSGLTYVDFMVAEFMDLLHAMNPEVFDDYPLIWEHVKRIHSLPQLKEYMEKRAPASADVKN